MINHPQKSKGGLRRIVNACRYSLQGMQAAFQHEPAFRQELWLALVLVPLAFFVASHAVERALLIASVILVLMLELVNSAIEAVVDRVSLEQHPLAKRAKDTGSAAVMLALLNMLVVWGLVVFGR